MTTDTQAYLLRAILECPDDDLPRLAYADWLEEQGDGHSLERAYDIRNRLTVTKGPGSVYTGHNTSSPYHRYYTYPRDPLTVWGCSERLPDYCDNGCSHRGFLYLVGISLAVWNSRAEELFRSHPITKVYLTDKKPYPPRNSWYDEERRRLLNGDPDLTHPASNLPTSIYNRLRRGDWRRDYRVYSSRARAFHELSNALVELGREAAGLPRIARETYRPTKEQP